MSNKSYKNKFLTIVLSCFAIALVFVGFNMRSNANTVSNNNLKLPTSTTNPTTKFITLNDKSAVFGLRKYPKVSTTSNVATRLKYGTKVTAYSESIINENITWIKVKYGSYTGWVNKKCLTDIIIDERANYWRYTSDESHVVIRKSRKFDSDIYIADIKINSALQFKHVYANGAPDGSRKTVVDMTKKYNPIIAINASGFDIKGDNHPRGTVGSKGQVDYFSTERASVLMGYDGMLNVVKAKKESDYKSYKPFWIASFGPNLINNNKMLQTAEKNKSIDPAPRVGIGQKDKPNEFVIIVVDGRSQKSDGINYYELATLFQEKGVRVAYNLDGGGSATLTFNNKIINKPSDAAGPRKVIDSLFIRDIR